ncbi:S1 RNA-binding domain-containing protein [Kitasatospora viridis]|uniref:Small subunit ribosomal protein S1 n=1 Tax=Kitasatospora viridis TaxID=281105 RepID=A0A561UDC0_9ACTN|nr:S1 RNA-binding domain-containing protein [Kitasatospora viridis]TWF97359.1 small subunit ribosomal protein S1 [Kitasatospora viridis]
MDANRNDEVAGLRVGDRCSGVVTGITRSRTWSVALDGFPKGVSGWFGPLELPWGRKDPIEVGDRITAEVFAVDPKRRQVRLSLAAAAHPELWAFLSGLRPGQPLTGTIASIERFGVFVALDEGPDHPVFPGVGFLTHPELSWQRFESVEEVVRVGERVRCEFLQFDIWNGEARLSLRAFQPDPFRELADRLTVGQSVSGRVTKVLPFGVFVRVAAGVEGLVHRDEGGQGLDVGAEVTTTVADLDLPRRRLRLTIRQLPA